MKTIQDLIKDYPDGWPTYNRFEAFWYPNIDGWRFFDVGYKPLSGAYQVATREQYEKALAESKQEWTHEDQGKRCRLLADKSDSYGVIPVQYEDGYYHVTYESLLIPLNKPKLTKAQAWDKVDGGMSAEEVKEKFDVSDS